MHLLPRTVQPFTLYQRAMLKLGTDNIGIMYLGTTKIGKAYLGSDLVYQSAVTIPPASAYNQNGLIFQLDGLEKGNTQGAWTDLISGVVYTNFGAVEEVDGWSFDGTSAYMRALTDPDASTYTEGKYTTEIVIVRKTDASDQPVFTFKHSNSGQVRCIILRTGNNNIQCVTGSTIWNNASSDIPLDMPVSYSRAGNMTYAYVNKVSKSIAGYTTAYISPTQTRIGGIITSSTERFFYGKIMAIRLYSRELSAAEVLANQEIDRKRFNLSF